MFAPYRRVLSEPGTLLFSASGLVARLPISMVGLGIVLLVEAGTGSYGLAGTVSAAYVLANAALAIVHGRLVDRLGQSRVLPVAVSVFGVSLVLMVWAVQDGWPTWSVLVLAALMGAAMPQVGACVRTRWSHVLHDARSVQTAYALESVLDEVVFVVGPVLVTMLATAWHPIAGLATALVTGVGGTLALSAQRRTEPPPHPRRRASPPQADMPWRTVAPLAALFLALGTLFGATEVATVAFTEERGATQLAGVLLGLWSFGSLVSGLITGAIAWRASPAVRMRWTVLALTLAMTPLALIDSMPVMAPVLFVGGFAIAPTLIAVMQLTEQTVPPARLTEGMAVLHTGIAAGVAPGAAFAGVVVDAYGASAAYLLPVAAGLVGIVAAWATPRHAARADQDPGAAGVGSGHRSAHS